MSNLDLSLIGDQKLQLPFKPFLRSEVEDITQAHGGLIDAWWGKALEERVADLPGHLPGLDYMQTFAIYAASRWMEEGADMTQATGLVIFVGNLGQDVMEREFEMGNTFPTPTAYGGILVPHKRLGSLGARCNLQRLFNEFKVRVEMVFPANKKSERT